MQPLEIAIQLTMMGLNRGREYSCLGIDLYTERGAYGGKTFVVAHDHEYHRFKSAFKGASFFALLVDKLRRDRTN